jgi:hypothetical protein
MPREALYNIKKTIAPPKNKKIFPVHHYKYKVSMAYDCNGCAHRKRGTKGGIPTYPWLSTVMVLPIVSPQLWSSEVGDR